ncbi:unnamed protein product, partial [Bubo scandiacus]
RCPTAAPSLSSSSCHLQTNRSCRSCTSGSSWASPWLPSWATASSSPPSPVTTTCTPPCTSSSSTSPSSTWAPSPPLSPKPWTIPSWTKGQFPTMGVPH